MITVIAPRIQRIEAAAVDVLLAAPPLAARRPSAPGRTSQR